MQQHREKFENLPEDLRVAEACDHAGFIRNVFLGQFFVTIHDNQLAGFGCTGEMTKDPDRKDLFEAIPELAQYGKSRLRVTSTVMETELPEEKKKLLHTMKGTDGCETHADGRARGDGWQTPGRKTWLSGQVRAEKLARCFHH